MIPGPGPTPYERLGGDERVRALVDAFYRHMECDPQYAGIRALHPELLTGSRDKLYWFLSGWLGGPPLYFQKRGDPRLRARHLPFAIGANERDQWLACMRQALLEIGADEPLTRELMRAFGNTADFMRNRDD
ncbi:MAG TPA: group II truncated hemoglobin [Casimicrobiaceae bacterium]|nr:group II truncated hemoglobin [Casimicrobiaceae bacterium]